MRVIALASLTLGLAALAAAPAHGQTRYGPRVVSGPSAIAGPPQGPMLSWPGKTSGPDQSGMAAAVRPEPLTDWARRQAAAPPVQPLPMTALPAPASQPGPIAAPTAVPTPLAGPPAGYPSPQRMAAAAPPSAPAAIPTAQAQPLGPGAPATAGAPAPAPTNRPYPGYGQPQMPAYPGYQPPAPPPPPAYAPQAQAPGQQGARFYSVAREFGMQPDPIAQPITPVGNESITLDEIPTSGLQPQSDDTIYVPPREQGLASGEQP